MKPVSMAQLGRDALTAYQTANNTIGGVFYVNKTSKYVSIKIEEDHLSDEELVRAAEILREQHPTRFVKIYNNTATPVRSDYIDGKWTVHSWKSEKVNVRFTQA